MKLRMAMILSCWLLCGPVFAQENPENTKYAWNVYGGRFLPYGIYGVRDIYPYWGVRFGHKIWGIEPEYSSYFINALGVSMTDLAASVAFPFDVEDITYRPFIGVDFVYYQGHNNVQELPLVTTAGFHIGVSPLIKITNNLAIRVDFKMNFGPGKSLHVGGGLEFYY